MGIIDFVRALLKSFLSNRLPSPSLEISPVHQSLPLSPPTTKEPIDRSETSAAARKTWERMEGGKRRADKAPYRRRKGWEGWGKKGMGGGVHGRATRARSIKRAFTIDQRSIEVDHELKTVVTREARRPRQLFARLCKYLATERGGWAPSWSVPSSTREYHTEEGGCNNTRGALLPRFLAFRAWNAAHRIAPISNGLSHRANRAGIRVARSMEWHTMDRRIIPEVHRQPSIPSI